MVTETFIIYVPESIVSTDYYRKKKELLLKLCLSRNSELSYQKIGYQHYFNEEPEMCYTNHRKNESV